MRNKFKNGGNKCYGGEAGLMLLSDDTEQPAGGEFNETNRTAAKERLK